MRDVPAEHWIEPFDGLRAFAAMAVFGVHFQQITQVHPGMLGPLDLQRLLINGNVGVSLFFTLSGFLLSMPFWRALTHAGPAPSLGAYWLKRVARIVPAYYLCLTVLLLWSGALFDPDDTNNVVLHYLFAFNFSRDYFYDFNPPFWTLAVEMQFYVALPVLFMLVRPFGFRGALLALFVLALLAYGLQFALVGGAEHSSSVVVTHSLLAHLPHFLFGTLAAGYRIVTARRGRDHRPSAAADVIGLLAIVAAVALIGTPLGAGLAPPSARYFWPLLSIAFVAILLAVPRAALIGGALSLAPIRYAGRISYGIYLFHYPAMRLVERVMAAFDSDPGARWLVFALASFAVTILISSASYLALERPVQTAVARALARR